MIYLVTSAQMLVRAPRQVKQNLNKRGVTASINSAAVVLEKRSVWMVCHLQRDQQGSSHVLMEGRGGSVGELLRVLIINTLITFLRCFTAGLEEGEKV